LTDIQHTIRGSKHLKETEDKVVSRYLSDPNKTLKEIGKEFDLNLTSVSDRVEKYIRLNKKQRENGTLYKKKFTLATDNEWAMVHKYSYDEVKNELPYKTNKSMKLWNS